MKPMPRPRPAVATHPTPPADLETETPADDVGAPVWMLRPTQCLKPNETVSSAPTTRNTEAATTDLDRLLMAVQHHAGCALGAPGDHPHAALDAVTHAGAAVELAAKAVLINLDPRLVDKSPSGAYHDLLEEILYRAERPPSGAAPGRGRQTIDARVAVELAARTDPNIERHASRAKGVLTARNRAVHWAEPPGGALNDLTEAMAAFVEAAVIATGGTADWL